MEYFDLTAQEKVAQKLPKNFYLEVYTCMNDWLQHKASIKLPHAYDTLNPEDANYEGRDAFVVANAEFAYNCNSQDTGANDDDNYIDAAKGNQTGLPICMGGEALHLALELSGTASVEEVWGDGELPPRQSNIFSICALYSTYCIGG